MGSFLARTAHHTQICDRLLWCGVVQRGAESVGFSTLFRYHTLSYNVLHCKEMLECVNIGVHEGEDHKVERFASSAK